MFKKALGLLLLCLSFGTIAQAQDYHYDPTSTTYDPDWLSTFSIIVRDPNTGELGIGVASRVLAVGRNGSTFRGGVAVIVHQMSSNPYYGRIGMEMLMAGLEPQEVMARLVRSDEDSASRQVAILDIHGHSAAFTGGGPLGQAVWSEDRKDPEEAWKGHKCGVDYCAQANSMISPAVVDNMAKSFESTKGKPIADRILDAMDAGLAGGGDRRGQQSAALFIVKPLAGAAGYSDVSEDLRVNDSPAPLVELRRLLTVRRSGEIVATANREFERGNRDQALQQLLQLRDKIPTTDAVWIALAGMYVKMNRKADAFEAIRKAVELNPANKRKGSGGLPKNPTFDPIKSDPEWVRIMSSGE